MTRASGSVTSTMAEQRGHRRLKSLSATAMAFSGRISGVNPAAPHSGHLNSSCIVPDFIQAREKSASLEGPPDGLGNLWWSRKLIAEEVLRADCCDLAVEL